MESFVRRYASKQLLFDKEKKENEYMALSYNRMWKLLVDKKMSKADLRKAADIAPNTMTKLRRDEAVNLAILGRICQALDCDFGDIVEYVSEFEEGGK